MTATDARVEVLTAAVRAIAQALTREQPTMATKLLLDHLHPLARHSMSETVDNAMAREVASLVVALSK
jgi:hypothetical protein